MNNEIYQPEYSVLMAVGDVIAVVFLFIAAFRAYWYHMRVKGGYDTMQSKFKKRMYVSVAIICFAFLWVPSDIFRKYDVGQYRLVKAKEDTFIIQELVKVKSSKESLKEKGINIVEGREYFHEKWNNNFITKDSIQAVQHLHKVRELKKEEVVNKIEKRENLEDSMRSIKVYGI